MCLMAHFSSRSFVSERRKTAVIAAARMKIGYKKGL